MPRRPVAWPRPATVSIPPRRIPPPPARLPGRATVGPGSRLCHEDRRQHPATSELVAQGRTREREPEAFESELQLRRLHGACSFHPECSRCPGQPRSRGVEWPLATRRNETRGGGWPLASRLDETRGNEWPLATEESGGRAGEWPMATGPNETRGAEWPLAIGLHDTLFADFSPFSPFQAPDAGFPAARGVVGGFRATIPAPGAFWRRRRRFSETRTLLRRFPPTNPDFGPLERPRRRYSTVRAFRLRLRALLVPRLTNPFRYFRSFSRLTALRLLERAPLLLRRQALSATRNPRN